METERFLHGGIRIFYDEIGNVTGNNCTGDDITLEKVEKSRRLSFL